VDSKPGPLEPKGSGTRKFKITQSVGRAQIGCIEFRTRVGCAKQRSKTEFLLKTVPSCVDAGHTRRGGHAVPASYQIDKARRLVISIASGFLTAEDLVTHQRKLLGDPDFDPSCSQIFDCKAVTGIDFNAEDVGALAARTIFLASFSPRDIGYDGRAVRSFPNVQMIREGHGEHGIRVFRDQREAFRWALPEAEAFSKTA